MATIYYLLDNSNGEVCFLNSNTACFQEILQPYDKKHFIGRYRHEVPFNYDLRRFFLGKQVHIFIEPSILIEQAELFINRLETVFGTYRIEPIENDCQLWDKHSVFNKFVSDCGSTYKYKVVINVDDFATLNHFKYALYMLRPLFESMSLIPRLIQSDIPENIDFWQWQRIVWSQSYCNHNYFNLQYYKGSSMSKNTPQGEFFNDHFAEYDFSFLSRIAVVHSVQKVMLTNGEDIISSSQQATIDYLNRIQQSVKKIQTKTKTNV